MGAHVTSTEKFLSSQVFIQQLQELHCRTMLFPHNAADQLSWQLKPMLATSILNLHPVVVAKVGREAIFIGSHVDVFGEVATEQLSNKKSVRAIPAATDMICQDIHYLGMHGK